MPLTARGHNYRLGAGKQSAQDTANATAAYEWSIYDGFILPQKDERAFAVMAADDIVPGHYRARNDSVGNFTVNSDPAATPFWWKLHLGAEAIAGAGDPYTHTITKQDAKSFATIYGMRPDVAGGTNRWERQLNAMVKTVELSATKGEPLQTRVETLGTAHRFNVSAPTITADSRIGASGTEVHSMIGSTLKMDIAATPATTTVTNIESLVITSTYPSAEWIQTNTAQPSYLSLGAYSLGCSVTAVFDSFASYAATFFGTASITSDMDQSLVVVAGAGDFTFNITPTPSANRTLVFTLPSMVWEVTPPSPATAGDAVRATMTAKVQKPASGEAITVAAKNSRSTVY